MNYKPRTICIITGTLAEYGLLYWLMKVYNKRFSALHGRKNMEDLLRRITFNKDVLCGKPIIRGLRMSVEAVLKLLAEGATEQEILEDYPELEPDDIRAILLYAQHMVAKEDVFDRVGAQG
jgi:uncharacterized protein (DUF433 family)